jgi:hypothetical protein
LRIVGNETKNTILNNTISKKWANNQMLGYDSISFSSGLVIVLDSSSTIDSNQKRMRYCSPFCETTIESILKYDSDPWTEIQQNNNSIKYNNKHIIYGEGAMGNEGFISLLNQDLSFIWGLFMTFSNPICEIVIENQNIIASSTYDFKIVINIETPQNIHIINL